MDKNDSLNLIGIVLAIVTGLSIASQIENTIEGLTPFYYTNMNIDYSYGTGEGRSDIIGMLIMIIVFFSLIFLYYLKLHLNHFVTLGDSFKNIINYFMYLKMLFVGLGVYLFAFMGYQIYKHGDSMDVTTLVLSVIFVVLYSVGGIYLFFYDHINAIFKSYLALKEVDKNDEIKKGGLRSGDYLGESLMGLGSSVILVFGIILIPIIIFFITGSYLFSNTDTKSHIIAAVLYSLIAVEVLGLKIYTTLFGTTDPKVNITGLIVMIILICFIFSKIYVFDSKLKNTTTDLGIFLNVLEIFIIAFYIFISLFLNIDSVDLFGKTIELIGESVWIIILLILTIEIIMTGVACFSQKTKFYDIIGSITISIGCISWIFLIINKNIGGLRNIINIIV